MNPRTAPTSKRSLTRRGTVVVAIIIALVALQLVVAGVAVSGARDQDLIVRRLDTARAFYAAEAGINMALREVMQGADEDGDGTIGTVSNNGLASDDPNLSGGRASVSSATDTDGIITLSSQGRAGDSRRRVQARVE